MFLMEAHVAKKLYVGNLPFGMTGSDLQNLFEKHGRVESAQVVADRDTGRSRGFGFVEMGTGEEAEAAVAALNGQEVNGRALTVNEARPREDRGGSRGEFANNRRGYGGGRRY
jgi:cold-inducible RNA-binding protein